MSPETKTLKADKRKVVVVMADTRTLPTSTPKSFEEATWEQLVAVMNLKYAQSHGYEFVHYKLGNSEQVKKDGFGNHATGCKHPTYGVRHPSWCKLLGVHVFDALLSTSKLPVSSETEDPIVMYVDSDMVRVLQQCDSESFPGVQQANGHIGGLSGQLDHPCARPLICRFPG